jgi:hypothetical protein
MARPAFHDETRNLGGKVRRIDVPAGSGARRSVPDDAAALLGSDNGERGGSAMGAALGAAGDVDRDRVRTG